MNTKLCLAIAASAFLAIGAVAPARADTSAPAAVASAPVYNGAPDVNVTAAFYSAGGGSGGYGSWRNAGERTFGEDNADLFPHMFDYAINVAWTHAGKDNVVVPPFGSHEGQALARDLIHDGTAPDGTFWTGYMMDHTLTAKVHAQVNRDLVSKFGADDAAVFDRMSNQFFFDISQVLDTKVALAPNH